MARPERFELPTLWFEARCSIQLSYGRTARYSVAFEWHGSKRRRGDLYPPEVRAREYECIACRLRVSTSASSTREKGKSVAVVRLENAPESDSKAMS